MNTGRRVTWILVGAALALRVGWVLYRWACQGAGLEYPDEELHWQLAHNLVTTGALVTDDGRFAPRMPLYPLFLTLFAGLGAPGVLAARLAQAVIGATTVALGQRWAEAALGGRAALVAGVLLCVDPYAVFFANLLLTEVLFTLLAVGLAACAWHVVSTRQGQGRAWVGVAVCGALALLTRPSAAAWIPLVWALVILLVGNRGRASLRAGGCALVLLLALLPWGLRNQVVLGAPAWLSANAGLTLYDAQGPQADGSSNQSFLRDMPELAELSEIERDRVLRSRALAQMRADPRRVLTLAGVKLLRLWNPWPNVQTHRDGAAAWAGAIYTMGLLLLAFCGVGRLVVLRKCLPERVVRFQVLLWSPIVYFTILHCVYIGSVRYRMPLMPFLALGGAAVVAVRVHADDSPPAGSG